tara:strand:- start:10630 stop:11043 length:414 start_codon:yes stop_codon:yes gene_type:complete
MLSILPWSPAETGEPQWGTIAEVEGELLPAATGIYRTGDDLSVAVTNPDGSVEVITRALDETIMREDPTVVGTVLETQGCTVETIDRTPLAVFIRSTSTALTPGGFQSSFGVNDVDCGSRTVLTTAESLQLGIEDSE